VRGVVEVVAELGRGGVEPLVAPSASAISVKNA
jgi:hypothetical protein